MVMKPFKGKSLVNELNNVMALILENDTVTKLLYHDTPDALSQPNLTVAQKRELIGKRIIKRKSLKVLENNSGSFVSFRLNHFRPSMNNPNTLVHTVDIYVVCHEGTIETDSGERDLLLVEALSQVFYLQNVLGTSGVKVNAIEDLVFDSNDFVGYLLSFEVTNETLTQ